MYVYCILVGTDLYYIQENILASLESGVDTYKYIVYISFIEEHILFGH